MQTLRVSVRVSVDFTNFESLLKDGREFAFYRVSTTVPQGRIFEYNYKDFRS